MNAHVDLGETRTYKLTKALLIYEAENRMGDNSGGTAVSVHEVQDRQLGPGQPITRAAVESLAQALGRNLAAGWLPPQLVSLGFGKMAWFCPAGRRRIWFKADGRFNGGAETEHKDTPKVTKLNGKFAQHPPLLFVAGDHKLAVFALIWGNDVLFVACLPKPDHHYEISGHICKKCAWPFSQIYGRVYGQINEGHGGRYRTKKGFWPLHSAQRIHARKCFDRNPARLRDLETDYAQDLETLQKKWGITSNQTYHEWLLLEHCGVRIYSTSFGDRHGDGWLLLKPEPKYRAMAYGGWVRGEEKGHALFCASSLPTYPNYDHDAPENQGKYHDHYGWGRQHSIPAIKKAIEQGFIKQDGTFDKDGQPHHYG